MDNTNTIANIKAAFELAEKANSLNQLDTAKGLEAFAGKDRLYIKGLELLRKKLATVAATIAPFTANPNDAATLNDFIIYVHGLKGSFANLGAYNLSDKAKELELAGKSGDIDYCVQNSAHFINATDDFLAVLNGAFDSGVKSPSTQTADDAELYKLLDAVGDGAEAFDLDKVNAAIDKLTAQSFGDKTDTKIKRLKKYADDFLTFEIINSLSADFKDEGYN
ncbi:MAG: Hpt domain-containing protein [Oscillospiraceae bacterium]|nr:Hpt domain-containing protein [Oscillospiraceae bacterium]